MEEIQISNLHEKNLDANSRKGNISHKKLFIFTLITFMLIVSSTEIISRIIGLKPFPEIPYADSDYEVEWELRKNFDDDSWLVRDNPDGTKSKIRIKTNSLGLRDEDFSEEKSSDEFRVLFLGDSVIFGFKLNIEETVPYYFNLLGQGIFNKKKLRTINAGVDGYSTFQEFSYLKKRGIKLSPDLVILGFVLNDIFEPYLVSKARGGSGSYAGLAGQKSFTRSLLRFACQSAFFTKVFFEYLKIKNQSKIKKQTSGEYRYRSTEDIYNTENLFKYPLSQEIEYAWIDVEKEILKIKNFTDENNIRFMIVVFPYAGQVVDKIWSLKPQERINEFCIKNRISIKDLAGDFLLSENPKDLFLLGDGNHLSPSGAKFSAEKIIYYLKDNQMIE